VSKKKKPSFKTFPTPLKAPKISTDPSTYWNSRPSWRISIIEMRDPFGWHQINRDTLERVRKRLVNLESQTWREILVQGKKRNHSIAIFKLCKEARDRLTELRLDDYERIWSLGVTATERIFGFLTDGVMDVLWWDPNHSVCPSLKP